MSKTGTIVSITTLAMIESGLRKLRTDGVYMAIRDFKAAAETEGGYGLAAYLLDNARHVCDCEAAHTHCVAESGRNYRIVAGLKQPEDGFRAYDHLSAARQAGDALHEIDDMGRTARRRINDIAEMGPEGRMILAGMIRDAGRPSQLAL